jgi:hypothetical protein
MPTETLRPNASGDKTECFPYPDGTNNWADVDETPSDDDATYVVSSLEDDLPYRDLYNIPDSSIPDGAVITDIIEYINIRKYTGTYSPYGATLIKTHGTEYIGDTWYPSTTYELHSTTWATNPYTGLPWTKAEVNALQIGVALASSGRLIMTRVRCTQVYVEINYTVGGVPKRKLMCVGR